MSGWVNGHLGVGVYGYERFLGLHVDKEEGPGRGSALNPLGVDGVNRQSQLPVKTAMYLVIDSLILATWIKSGMVKFCLKPDFV